MWKIISKEITKNIVSDKKYISKKLEKLGYKHESIKHKTSFIRPDNPHIHTQDWGSLGSS